MTRAGRVNRGLEVVADCLVLPIGAGELDDLHVFQDGDDYLVYSENDLFDYAGLEVFDSEGDSVGTIFLGSQDIPDALGPDGLDADTIDIIRIMMEYICYD